MCQCREKERSRHGKDRSCNISQCTAAILSEDRDALYQVANRPCACGYAWPSCTGAPHVLALDALAECLYKAEQHVAAFSTALGIIRLDPASAVVSIFFVALPDSHLWLMRQCRATAASPRSFRTC